MPNQKIQSELKSAFLNYLTLQSLPLEDFEIEFLKAPHKSEALPKDKMAIMLFIYKEEILKIGIAGSDSNPRFQYQHYLVKGNGSTLAKSLINDVNFKHGYDNENIGDWIKQNCSRINIFVSTRQNRTTMDLLKVFLASKFSPKY